MPDLDIPLFSVAEAAEASGVSVNTLRSHLQSGVLGLGNQDAPAPAGGTRLLSLRRLMQIAVMYELIRLHRLAPARAAQLALCFTDIADGSPLPDNGGKERDPGRTFGEGSFTWLVFHPENDHGRVVRITSATTALNLALPLGQNGLATGSWLPLDHIVKSVELFAERRAKLPRRQG